MLRVLDLFSGIGGFSLGLERTGGFETVAFCERDEYCRAVLTRHWPGVPCFPDVRTLTGADVSGIDVITAGFPCQPFSVAGQRKGADDERHLWPEIARLLGEIRPRFAILENVPGLLSIDGGRVFGDVLGDLAALGYDTEWNCISAAHIGAPHIRDRVWIVAYPQFGTGSERLEPDQERRRPAEAEQVRLGSSATDVAHAAGSGRGEEHANRGRRSAGICAQGPGGRSANRGQNVSDAIRIRLPQSGQRGITGNSAQDCQGQTNQFVHGGIGGQWATEPGLGRVASGIPNRVDRLRALGNSIVPQIAEIIGQAILESEGQ